MPSLLPGAPGRYRPIGVYGFLGDCHTGALVSSAGSVDWLCLPRLDDGSYFGWLLDSERGGWCAITPASPAVRSSRRYLDGTLVLETEWTVAGGRVRVTDCLTMRPGGARRPYRQLLRVVDGLEGSVDLRIEVFPGSTTGRYGRGSAAPDRPGRRSAATTGWSSRATCRSWPPGCTTWWPRCGWSPASGCASACATSAPRSWTGPGPVAVRRRAGPAAGADGGLVARVVGRAWPARSRSGGPAARP